MSPAQKLWTAVASAFLPFVLPAWLLGPALGLQGGRLWTLRLGLTGLGVLASGVVYWFMRQRTPRERAADASAPDDIDTTAAAAKAQLAASRSSGGRAFSSLPLVLVMGTPGSAKTTSIMRAGIGAELLAGGVSAGDTVAPTTGINVWYSDGTVFMESGGVVVMESARFARVIRHLIPGRLAAVFGRGSQAPRAAVVCVSCDDLLRPGAGESIMVTARMLQERLGQVARAVGVRLPVYVLFTKADRIPYFGDYVRNLSNDEARQALGATLPGDSGAAGLYSDRATALLSDAFQRIFLSLAEHRLSLLAREGDAERKPGAYEFPRELRKIAPLAVRFLVELCKPSQLHLSPILRGFYFTGVRPVVVTESAPVAGHAQAALSQSRGATAVFDAARIAAAHAATPAAPIARKVPQWVFLDGVLRDIVLADRAAMRATAGGWRVNILRRALLAGAAACGLLLAIALTTSFFGNRHLVKGTTAAARMARALPEPGHDGPSVESLQRLDTLRAYVGRLGTYQRDGAPLRLRFGLYTGRSVYPAARTAYFATFDRALFAATHDAMVSNLGALPDEPRPTDDYGASYNLLKTYLIATQYAEHSTAELVTPVLLAQWLGGRSLDSLHTALAERQFALYASELRFGNPYVLATNSGVVTRARGYLARFAGTEPIYRAMLAEVGNKNGPAHLDRVSPGATGYVSNAFTVPGAFTRDGYAAMQEALASADRFFEGEAWVLGPRSSGSVDKEKVLAELRQRYLADYVAAWSSYLQGAAVVSYGGVKDAATRLAVLAGPQSPLLAALSLASRHSGVDSQTISTALHPVRVVAPPGGEDKLIGEANQEYMAALASLQAALQSVANAPPGGADAHVAEAMTHARDAKAAANRLAQQFGPTGDAVVRAAVIRLLDEPIARVEPYLRNYGAAELNGKGSAFCARFGAVLNRFPFNPSATAQASPQAVAELFRPVTGALWTFYDETVQNVLVRQGNEYVSRPGGSVTVSPAFREFFNRAAAISATLFPAGASEPQLTFSVRPVLLEGVTEVSVSIDGATHQYSRLARPHTFTWNPSPTSLAEIVGTTPRGKVPLQSFSGPWAPFQLFNNASRSAMNGNLYTAEWAAASGAPIKIGLEVDFGNGAPVLRKGYFAGLRCVGRVAQ